MEAKNRIEVYREAAALFPVVKKIVQSFDGKCLNCRLEKALQEATEKHIYVSKRYRFLEIEYYPMHHGAHSQTIARISLDKLPDGKRIPAELIIESLHEQRVKFLKSAANLEMDIEKIDMYEKDADKEIINLAKELLEFGKANIEILKPYL